MVLLAGSELFTGNCLLVIPLCKKEITLGGMLKNWVVVYLGNMVGGIGVAAICVFSHQAGLFNNGLAASMISTAAGKVSLSFGDAFLRGIACNFLVCIAVWISFAAKQVSSKVSVANMYYIAAGIFAKGNAAYLEAATAAGADVSGLTWGAMFTKNLLPVTLGNIIGGVVFVGLAYWFVYLKDD